jgi:2-phospho-L-lactate/phosphoenolpyruvate guanylyltransferase
MTVQSDMTWSLERRRGVCALIAIKERERCKTRLKESVDGAMRVELVRSMLAAVLAAAASARTVRQTIVVSPERDQIPAAIPVLADTGESLNIALAQAHRMLRDFGCHEIIVLPADLPRITAPEIDALVHAGRGGGFSIAPDATGMGTNALCLASAQPFQFQFGPDSQRLHLQEAQRMGLTPQVVHLPGLAFDVDSPADLERLQEQQWRACLRA